MENQLLSAEELANVLRKVKIEDDKERLEILTKLINEIDAILQRRIK